MLSSHETKNSESLSDIVPLFFVIPFDTDPTKLILPPTPAFTPVGFEGRKTFLFGMSEKAKAARLRVIEQLVQIGAELSECERIDRDYLKVLMKKSPA